MKDIINKELIYDLEEGSSIYKVDGEKVRDFYDTDFVWGGHYYAYPDFIPEDEIWIEHMESIEDEKEVLAHELFEWYQMKYNKIDYEQAHAFATDVESALRKLQVPVDKKELSLNSLKKNSFMKSYSDMCKFARNVELQESLMSLLQESPNPDISKINQWVDKENVDLSELTEEAFEMLGDVLGKGKSVERPEDQKNYPQDQLDKGIKVEMEHTDNPLISEKITEDHLSEQLDEEKEPTYYTDLLDAGL